MNYLEHEIEVKFVDGLLAHSQEWQWFVEQIEQNYEIKAVNSWDEFCNNNYAVREVLRFFVKVLQVCKKDWVFSKTEFKEIWTIAKYYTGIETVQKCIAEISVVHCKVMFLCVWVAKLKNENNDSKYLFDTNVFTQRNYYKLVNLDSLIMHEKQILSYAQSIKLEGIELPIKCFCDNINEVEYSYNENFFVKHEDELINYNAFSFQTIKKDFYTTWQESYLLDMLQVCVRDRTFRPLYSSDGVSIPDVELWCLDILKEMKSFFNHKAADFILETVMYIKYDIEPSIGVKLLHCKLLFNEVTDASNLYKIRLSSSYQIVSYLFKDKKMNECNREHDYISLICQLKKLDDPRLIMELKDDGFPIDKKQKLIMTEFYDNCYKQIDKVDSSHRLLQYLRDNNATKLIDAEYLQNVGEKFNLYISENRDILVTTLFYEYMMFLIGVNSNNCNINVRTIHAEMIRIQKLWKESYFEKQCSNLQEFSQEFSIEKKQLEQYSDMVIFNPIIFARDCIPCTETKVLSVMEKASENAIQYMFTHMELNAIYPKKRNEINFERHDVDKKLLDYVAGLIEKKGYRFLNILEPEKYVKSLHEQYISNAQIRIGVLSKEKELYESIQNSVEIKLTPYSEELNLGMLVQLFPILEMKVRELATLLGVFPFKKSKEEFMEANDPSSLLREMLLTIYNEQHSFENVPDFLYIYNMMYNSNSLNIRNECVHGRKYIIGGELRFAFRITMFAILMVDFRIDTIRNNVSDLTEDTEEIAENDKTL